MTVDVHLDIKPQHNNNNTYNLGLNLGSLLHGYISVMKAIFQNWMQKNVRVKVSYVTWVDRKLISSLAHGKCLLPLRHPV